MAALHAELPRWGLVVWTARNVSERVVVDRGNGLFTLLDAPSNAGMTLTENFAMSPAASVSGFYLAHPQVMARIDRRPSTGHMIFPEVYLEHPDGIAP